MARSRPLGVARSTATGKIHNVLVRVYIYIIYIMNNCTNIIVYQTYHAQCIIININAYTCMHSCHLKVLRYR